MRKQKKLIFILLSVITALFVVLGVVFFTTRGNDVGDTEQQPPEKNFEGEAIDGTRLLIYEYILRADIDHITVSNEFGTYTLVQNKDGGNSYFSLEGASDVVAIDDTTMAALISVTGYTLISYYTDSETGENSYVVNRNPEEFYRYGLSVEDEATLPYYEIVKTDGTFYKVYIGDALPSDGGYYVRLDGRDAVYIRSSSSITDVADVGIENTVLVPSAYYAVPYITVNGGYTNSYMYIRNFTISETYGEGEDAEVRVGISYLGEEDRDIFNASEVYEFVIPDDMTYYTPNSNVFTYVAQLLQEWQGEMTLEVGLLDENDELDIEKLRPYGLDTPKYLITYEIPWMSTDMDINDVDTYMPFILLISEMTENGNYYIASLFCDTVVLCNAEDLDFLMWDTFHWVDNYVMPYNITTVSRIEMSADGVAYDFRLEWNGSDLSVYEAISGTRIQDVDNFKNWYVLLVALNYEGNVSLDDEEKAALISDNANSLTELKLTLSDDRVLSYRFFPYSSQRSLVSLEDSSEFYTLTASVKKIIRAAEELMDGKTIDRNSRY